MVSIIRTMGTSRLPSAALVLSFGFFVVAALIMSAVKVRSGGSTLRRCAHIEIMLTNLLHAARPEDIFPPMLTNNSQKTLPRRYWTTPKHPTCIQSGLTNEI